MKDHAVKKRLWYRPLLACLLLLVLAVVALVVFLTATEYRPRDRQAAEWQQSGTGEAVTIGDSLTIYSWNIGYAGLGAETDFFMDGGSHVNPSREEVARNLSAISDFLSAEEADAWFLQEIDVCSRRTGYTNEWETLAAAYPGSYALAYNYKCAFVPFPLPPIGRVEAGIATLTRASVLGEMERLALPCPFAWPVSTANLKRCLLLTRLKIEGSDKEVVLVNLHLEAYDDGEGKAAQTQLLMQLLQDEYEKGNYVIAGGDFNQTFPGVLDRFPVTGDVWAPGVMEESALPAGFSYAFDDSRAGCRLLNKPLSDDSQMYVLDGFIVSPNVQVNLAETVGLGFANADHEPVKLQVTLLPA